MSMRLLQALADASLPMEIKDVRVKEQLRALRDAGHIICSFPPRGSSDSEPACVHMVTALGRKVLLRYFGRKVVLGRKKTELALAGRRASEPDSLVPMRRICMTRERGTQ